MSGSRRGSYKPRGSFGSAKRSVRKRPDYSRRRLVGNATMAVPRMGMLKRPSVAETHYRDFEALLAGSVGITWTTLPLTACPLQGSAQTNRYGNSITIRRIDVEVIANAVADSPADWYNEVRVLYGIFKAPRGSGAPTASGVNGIMDNTSIASPYSPISQEFRANWTLLKDDRYKLSTYSVSVSPFGTPASGAQGRNYVITKKYSFVFPRGIVARMQANAGSAGDWETNIPFFCYGSDSGAISHPSLTVRTRMYFEP